MSSCNFGEIGPSWQTYGQYSKRSISHGRGSLNICWLVSLKKKYEYFAKVPIRSYVINFIAPIFMEFDDVLHNRNQVIGNFCGCLSPVLTTLPGVGVTTAPFVNVSIDEIIYFNTKKYLLIPLNHLHMWQASHCSAVATPVKYCQIYKGPWYSVGKPVFWQGGKNLENNGWGKIDLVTITHAWKILVQFVLDGLSRFFFVSCFHPFIFTLQVRNVSLMSVQH